MPQIRGNTRLLTERHMAEAIRLYGLGWKPERIGRVIGVHRTSVSRWIREINRRCARFEEGRDNA